MNVELPTPSRNDTEYEATAASRGASGVWWVNQGSTYAAGRAGGYVWAPQRAKNGMVLAHHANVTKLNKGDVILHYANGALRAISKVVRRAIEADRPEDLPGNVWVTEGYLAHCHYFDLDEPIKLDAIPIGLREQEPFAFNKHGRVNEGYLFPLSESFADQIHRDFSGRWPVGSPWDGNAPLPPPPTPPIAEVCTSFADALKAAHLDYGTRHQDLVRSFVVSLATKRFLLLTGLSGSGKTRLAIAFGQWLGHGRLKVVAVRPDWTGPDALLGYENGLSEAVNGRLAWQVPEALEFMLQAAGDPDQPYLLLLDEMNLAHVERYFADVLSGMESGADVLPNLRRGGDGSWRITDPERPRLAFPPNLLVVGTVNIDETTYMFSPKVLDRANTIEFRVATADLVAHERPPADVDPGPDALVAAFHAAATSTGVDGDWTGRTQMERYLRELHTLLATEDREFGHRVYFEALRFGSLLAQAGAADPLIALDLQVMQKVLPRLHGSIRQVSGTLSRLGAWCFDGPGAEIQPDFDPMNPPERDPVLPVSFDKIQRMTRRLRANHFVSFAE